MPQPDKAFVTRLTFKRSAKKEWDNLGGNVRDKFKKLLRKRASSWAALTPPKHQLSGVDHCYKIKLLHDGYRLVYQVRKGSADEWVMTIVVITVDRREDVYEKLKAKVGNLHDLCDYPLPVTDDEE